MELRRLQATDLIAMVRVLNAIDIKELKNAINFDEIKEARKNITDENKEAVTVEIGTNVIMSIVPFIFEKLAVADTEIYTFVASIAGMKVKDFAKIDAFEFTDLLISIFHKEEFKDFFKRASKLIK